MKAWARPRPYFGQQDKDRNNWLMGAAPHNCASLCRKICGARDARREAALSTATSVLERSNKIVGKLTEEFIRYILNNRPSCFLYSLDLLCIISGGLMLH
jgi:hypothetical protein